MSRSRYLTCQGKVTDVDRSHVLLGVGTDVLGPESSQSVVGQGHGFAILQRPRVTDSGPEDRSGVAGCDDVHAHGRRGLMFRLRDELLQVVRR